MRKSIGFVVLAVVFLFCGCASASKKSGGMDDTEKMEFIERQLVSLEEICALHKEIKDIDKSIEKLQPAAIVENNIHFVFDLDQSGEKYEFKMEFPYEGGDAEDIQAAYPLAYGNGKTGAVITEKEFETLEGRIVLFHEFVHCFQWNEAGILSLRQTLAIAREAWEKQDFMWELNHPFPYASEYFIAKTGELDKGYDIGKYHNDMKSVLSEKDFEYMIWQEFQEGYARYIENLIRERLGANKNSTPLIPPFERHIFDEIGSWYIVALIQNDSDLKGNLGALFQKMINCEI
jgi:hypothetical protein